MPDSVLEADVTVDRDVCVGTGDCARLAPGAFRIREEDLVAEVLPGAGLTDLVLLRDAEAACPMLAIRVTLSTLESGRAGS